MLRNWTRRLAGRRAWLAGAAALGLVAVTSWPGFSAEPADAPHHRGSPLTTGDPKVDHTDLYAFVSPDQPDTVTLIASWLPFHSSDTDFHGFATDARYDIHVDNDGDGTADLTYRWTFIDDYRDGPTRQRYTLTAITPHRSTVLVSDRPVAPPRGSMTTTAYSGLRKQAIAPIPGGHAFAGHADDPSFFDHRIFDAFYGERPSGSGTDTLAEYNVRTVAVQVPKAALALHGDPHRNPVVGVWSTTAKRTMTVSRDGRDDTMVQVSRLGNPLFTEIVGASDLADTFHHRAPAGDSRDPAFLRRVTAPETAQRVATSYGIPAPATPRNDLVEVFLTGLATTAPTLDGAAPPIRTDLNAHLLNADVDPAKVRPAEELRLNMAVPVTATPDRLGLLGHDRQGFPNGRRLGDDVVDIALQTLAGAAARDRLVPALAAGDGVDGNDVAFESRFPYVAFPNVAPGPDATPPAATAVSNTSSGASWLSLAAGVSAFALLVGGLVASWRFGRATTTGRYAVSR